MITITRYCVYLYTKVIAALPMYLFLKPRHEIILTDRNYRDDGTDQRLFDANNCGIQSYILSTIRIIFFFSKIIIISSHDFQDCEFPKDKYKIFQGSKIQFCTNVHLGIRITRFNHSLLTFETA